MNSPTDSNEAILLKSNASPIDFQKYIDYAAKSMITLDGLWYVNCLRILGPDKTFELDVRVFVSHFKLTTRLIRSLFKLDGKSISDKAQVFGTIARSSGHKFEVLKKDNVVTMRVHKCGYYENLKKAGRLTEYDCRRLCKSIAPTWFNEIEPRTGGKGLVDLQIPEGGQSCCFSIEQPDENNE